MAKAGWAAVIVALGITGTVTPCAADELVLPVQIRDQVGLDAQVVAAAQQCATTVFEKAGIRVRWLTATDRLPGGFVIAYIIPGPPEHARISVGALGYTNMTTNNPSQFTYVIDSRVEEMKMAYSVDKGTLVGLTIAHEIAHLVARVPHTASGIMHAVWTQKDMRLANQDLLVFSSSQAQTLRDAIAQWTSHR